MDEREQYRVIDSLYGAWDMLPEVNFTSGTLTRWVLLVMQPHDLAAAVAAVIEEADNA